MKGRMRRDEEDPVLRALRDAAEGTEPDVSRLVAAVPSIMAEARRRREARPGPESLAAILDLARWAVPALAAGAAGLVLAALLTGGADETVPSALGSGVDSLLLTGSVEAEGDDILLEALAGGGDGRA